MQYYKILPLGLGALMLASSAQASIFATEVVDHSASLDGSGYYNDANDLLGKPTTIIPAWGGGTSHVSPVEPAWGDNNITTFNSGDWAVVKFDHQVVDDSNNPYGLDLLVFGNAFFTGSGYVNDDTNHNTYTLTGGLFAEGVTVSVSQDGTDWYTYADGPSGDGLYPTNPWVWDPAQYDSTGNGWTDVENDYTKPVDPSLQAADFAGISYDAMLLYDGSAGGVGFDLAESDYDWIQYVKVTGTGGEVDAFADVAPAAVPVPAAAWLLGSGLLGLVGIRRNKKQLRCKEGT